MNLILCLAVAAAVIYLGAVALLSWCNRDDASMHAERDAR